MSKNAKCSFPLKGKMIFFATANINKFNEARNILSKHSISVGMLKLKGYEIQSESLKEIAETSVKNAYERSQLPIFVEDAGLFIDALKGFPGPYAAYVFHTIQNKGILNLMQKEKGRQATFQSVIAYCDEKNLKPIYFIGESTGEITQSERIEQGKSGFGFDPIFQPYGSAKTFAEMTIEEKNGFSHRANAIEKFAVWYEKQGLKSSS